MIKAFYTYLKDSPETSSENNPEIVEHKQTVNGKHEITDVIDNYPWTSEIELSAKYDQGGSFYFLLGDEDGLHASYQFVPVEMHKGLLFLNIVAKKGFLGIFGNQSVTVDFDEVSSSEVKTKVNDLLTFTIEELYEKYKDHKG